MQDKPYSSWIARTEPNEDDLSFMEGQLLGFWEPPRLSVLLVVSDPDEIWIKKSVSSVLEGIYPHVELCICDNGSKRSHVKEALEDLAASDERVKVLRRRGSADFAEAHNEALSLATGTFVVVLGEGDELAPDALFSVVELLENVEADVVYGDEDSVDISDRRSEPVFKSYWSPDLLLSTGYVGRPCVIRRSIVEDLGGFREGFEEAEEHDLVLRVAEKTNRVHHLPKVLYHRRVYEREPIREGHGEQEGALRAVSEALERRAVEATVELGLAPGAMRVVRSLSGRPAVSVVALITGANLIDRAAELERETSYPVREVILASGGEVAAPGSVNGTSAARAANLAASNATGEYLLFLHNYVRTSSPDLVARLLQEAQRPEVGVVGGRVLNHNGSVRCAGTFLDLSRLTGSPLGVLAQEEPSRYVPVVDLPFNPLAVSSGCMMVRRSVFEGAGGFDEDKVPATFYDLDLSFRLREKGLLNVYTPEASVFSLRSHRPLPAAEEIAYMWERWWPELVKALHYRESPLHAVVEELEYNSLPLVSV